MQWHRSSWLLVGILLISASGYSETQTPVLEKLQHAQRLAARIQEKTDNPSDGLRVLEDARIGNILTQRPSEYPQQAYRDLLYDYAKLLFQVPERYLEAEPILQHILRMVPDDYLVHFLLGDWYYRRYQSDSQERHREIYAQHYWRYVELLREQALKTALPQRVIDTVYNAVAMPVCPFLTGMVAAGRETELANLFDPETDIAWLQPAQFDSGAVPAGETFSGFVNNEAVTIRRSHIDIDNDGIAEIRYYKKAPVNGCARNVFYRQTGSKQEAISYRGLAHYYKAEYLCGDSNLSFLQYRNKNYFLEKLMVPGSQADYALYELQADGENSRLCTFNKPLLSKKRVLTACDSDICQTMLAHADTIIAAEGQYGAERAFDDAAVLSFDSEVLADPALQKYITARHFSLADLDGDGRDELIARLWESTVQGRHLYSHHLFRPNALGQWQLFELPLLPQDQWFFVFPHEGSVYLVSYAVYQNQVDKNVEFFYEMTIYRLQQQTDRLVTMGTIRFAD